MHLATFVQGAFLVLFLIACIWGLVLGELLRKHIRECHPKVYARFGYPRSKPFRLFDWPSSKEEEQTNRADWDYSWTISRGELNKIQDDRLHALLRRLRAVSWTAAVLMVGCVVTIAFR